MGRNMNDLREKKMILDVNAAKETAIRAHNYAWDMLTEAMEMIEEKDRKIKALSEIVYDKEKEIETIKSAINTDITNEEHIERLNRKKIMESNDVGIDFDPTKYNQNGRYRFIVRLETQLLEWCCDGYISYGFWRNTRDLSVASKALLWSTYQHHDKMCCKLINELVNYVNRELPLTLKCERALGSELKWYRLFDLDAPAWIT